MLPIFLIFFCLAFFRNWENSQSSLRRPSAYVSPQPEFQWQNNKEAIKNPSNCDKYIPATTKMNHMNDARREWETCAYWGTHWVEFTQVPPILTPPSYTHRALTGLTLVGNRGSRKRACPRGRFCGEISERHTLFALLFGEAHDHGGD